MKSSLKIMLSILLFVSPLTSFAQWRFKAKVVSTSGLNTIEATAVKSSCEHINSQTWKDEKECNEARKGYKENWGNHVRVYECECLGKTIGNNGSGTEAEQTPDNSHTAIQDSYYNALHNNVDYKANAGYEQMQKTQPKGTERLKAGYIPRAKPVSSSDIVGVISKTRRNSSSTIKLLDEHAVPNTGQAVYLDFDAVFDTFNKYEKELKKRIRSNPDYLVWKQLGSQLEDGQRAFINSMIIDENGYRPQYIGFKDDYYFFKSCDGKKIFKISPDGDAIFEYEFNDKFWNEDNIVKKITDGSIKQYLEESFSLKYNEIKPFVDLDGLSKNGVMELTSLAPKIKADLQMVIIDRSRTKYSRGYYIPESVDFPVPSSISLPMVGSVGLPTSVNFVFGYSNSASSGRNITGNASANASLTGVGASAGIKVSDGEVNGKVQQGAVITCGKKKYWVTFDASGSIGAGASAGANASLSLDEGVGAKVELGFPIYFGVGSKIVFKDLSPTDEFEE